MNQLDFYKNELQMDYFSEHYRKFESDFYRYSALDTPLTFLTDDIMDIPTEQRQTNFNFDIEKLNDSKLTRKYVYQRTTSIRQKD